MWADLGTCSFMSNSTGVSIPSTMTKISPDQLEKLNKMSEKYESFEISVAEGNPVYGVDENGFLYVKGVAVAKNTTTRASYSTISTALTAAKAGETVILLADCSADTVVVPANVVLDLNGHVVQAENVLSFGAVVDTADSVGGIAINADTTVAFTKLQPENGGYLPIYDTRDGRYKFFTYGVQSNDVTAIDAESVRFTTRIVFDRAEAYEVLANTDDSEMEYVLTMEWTGVTSFKVRYTMSDATVKKYAQAAYEQIQADGSSGKAMTITVKGVNKLGEGATISAAPCVETLAEVGSSADALVYTIP